MEPPNADYRTSRANPLDNRYSNIPCLESTRIVLPPKPNCSDYIHANAVRLLASKSATYIAAQVSQNTKQHDVIRAFQFQCPTVRTVCQFYRMLRAQRVKIVLNIASVEEIRKGRSFKYWAEAGETVTLSDRSTVKTLKVSPYSQIFKLSR